MTAGNKYKLLLYKVSVNFVLMFYTLRHTLHYIAFCLPLVDSVGMEEQERERRRQVVEKFQKAPFEEIAAHCGARV